MQAVRQIVDVEKLCQIVDIPENMRHSQVEVIVLPVAAKAGCEYLVPDKLYGVLREPGVGRSASCKLTGMLADTGISSYKFMENKKHEIELEEEKFKRNMI